jgi:hypothetical protein
MAELPEERMRVPRTAPSLNHGRTTAAWITIAVVLVGAAAATVAVVLTAWVLFWIGVALIVTAVAVGLVLRGLGFGQPRPAGPSRGSPESGSDVRDQKENP